MEQIIEGLIKKLALKVEGEVTSGEALQFSQAILNLANVSSMLKQKGVIYEEIKHKKT